MPTSQFFPILQDYLRFAPWMDEKSRRLPGVMPMEAGNWLQHDEARMGQLAEKARLLAQCPEKVHALSENAMPAAIELLDYVLEELRETEGFKIEKGRASLPDGTLVVLDRDHPLITLSQLVQEDFVIMEKPEGSEEHILTGALLCFPASWTLAQKFMKPLIAIHVPVDRYDPDVAKRVQRMFDAIRPERPLWRANALFYEDPALFQPRPENAPRVKPKLAIAPYVRSERQSLLRLPKTNAVIFSIHTTLIGRENMTEAQAQGLLDYPIEEVPA